VSSGIDSGGLPATRNQGIIPIRWEVIPDSFPLHQPLAGRESHRPTGQSLRMVIRLDPIPSLTRTTPLEPGPPAGQA